MKLIIGDKYRRVVDAMNDCFYRNYETCGRGWYQLNKYKKTSAWFPKIADLSLGKPIPGDKAYSWCNTISKDGKFIYMNNFENPDLLNKAQPNGIEPHVTFIMLPHTKYYVYAGVFTRKHLDKELGWVYERIAEDIETEEYI